MRTTVKGNILGAVLITTLAMVLSATGIGQAVASGVEKSVQRVMIANSSLTVSVKNIPNVKIDPSSPAVQVQPGAPSQPVQFGGQIALKTEGPGEETQAAYTVPSGKRLVLTFVSAHYSQQSSDEFAQAGFSVGSGPIFFIPVTNEAGPGRGTGYDFEYVGSELTQVYAEAGQQVVVHVPHNTVATSTVSFAFSGYLVNLQ